MATRGVLHPASAAALGPALGWRLSACGAEMAAWWTNVLEPLELLAVLLEKSIELFAQGTIILRLPYILSHSKRRGGHHVFWSCVSC